MWGHKLTVSAYFEGEPTDAGIDLAIRVLNNAWPDAVFIGVRVDEVETEPQDQGTSALSSKGRANDR
jgi:hypothetical protein